MLPKQKEVQMFIRVSVLIMIFFAVVGCSLNRGMTLQEASGQAATSSETASESISVKDASIPRSENSKVVAVSTPFGEIYQKKPEVESAEPEKEKEDIPDVSPVLAESTTAGVEDSVTEKPAATFQRDAASKGATKEEASDDIQLNFDNADLYEVIRTMAEMLNINYILDNSIQGTVTINSSGGLKSEDLWPVFFQILEANGLTAVREGNLYKIAPLKDAPRLPILSRYGRNAEDLQPTERVVMQIIPLRYAASSEMVKVLKEFISSDGTIISHESSNTLLIVDKGINILKAIRLVEVFDNNYFNEKLHRFFFLSNADATEVTSLLTKTLAVYSRNDKTAYEIIPITRLNALLVLSKNEAVFSKVEALLKAMDSVNSTAQKKIYVYAVKNGAAAELGELLEKIFGGEGVGSNGPGRSSEEKEGEVSAKDAETPPASPSTPFGNISTPSSAAKAEESITGTTPGEGTGTLSAEIKITPDEVRNSLIIEATPADYRIVENILEKLDVMPRQVLIEMTFAEVTLDDSLSLGVEWKYVDGEGDVSGNTLATINSGSGLRYVVGQTDRWTAELQALAENSQLNIIAAPSILASDNKEAQIDIADEIPVVSSTYENTQSDIVTTNVQYRNTGLILKVTPHINENGMVSMDIDQEISEVADNTFDVAGIAYPSFSKRTVATSLAVKHQQTIVIGGLMKETKRVLKAGVPGLKEIPVFGFLFGKDSNKTSKRELIILITPHVIVNLADIDDITSEVKTRLDQARQNMSR